MKLLLLIIFLITSISNASSTTRQESTVVSKVIISSMSPTNKMWKLYITPQRLTIYVGFNEIGKVYTSRYNPMSGEEVCIRYDTVTQQYLGPCEVFTRDIFITRRFTERKFISLFKSTREYLLQDSMGRIWSCGFDDEGFRLYMQFDANKRTVITIKPRSNRVIAKGYLK